MAKGTSSFRQFPADLFQTKSFRDLSPLAKAVYFTMYAQLLSYGVGKIPSLAILAELVNCTRADLDDALEELTPTYLDCDHDNGVYCVLGCERSVPWNDSVATFAKRTLSELPASPVIDRYVSRTRRVQGENTVCTPSKDGGNTVAASEAGSGSASKTKSPSAAKAGSGWTDGNRRVLGNGTILVNRALREDQQPREDSTTRNAELLEESDSGRPRSASRTNPPPQRETVKSSTANASVARGEGNWPSENPVDKAARWKRTFLGAGR